MTSTPIIPMVDLKAQYARIRGEVEPAVARVLESAHFIKGEDCGAFEEEFAAYCGASDCVGVANGTDALTIALRAYGVGSGDEVVTVANTFIATGEAVFLNGARPVFVDVDAGTHTMDPSALEAAIGPKAKVLIPVHLYGHPAPMEEIVAIAQRKGLPVLEDAAQAHGAEIAGRRAGSLGHAACFSFYPGKNLGAYGDAGAVVSNDKAFVERVRQIANHGGGTNKYDNVVVGTNSRLDSVQAAILRVKLRHLDQWNAERREWALLYGRLLADVPGIVLPRERSGVRSAWHLYTIQAEARDGLQKYLGARGIATAVHYPRPIHLQPAMAEAGGRIGDLPVSEELSQRVICLPLYPELGEANVVRVCDEVRTFMTGAGAASG